MKGRQRLGGTREEARTRSFAPSSPGRVRRAVLRARGSREKLFSLKWREKSGSGPA